MPLRFEPNRGQTDLQVQFLTRGPGYHLSLTATAALLGLQKPVSAPNDSAEPGLPNRVPEPNDPAQTRPSQHAVLEMHLVGGNLSATGSGVGELRSKSNYFRGNDPQKWYTDVPNYAGVRYQDIYPGIDVTYYGTNQRQLEFDFTVAPGAHPDVIRLRYQGSGPLHLDAQGNLILDVPDGQVVQQAPVLYQTVNDNRQTVAGGFVLLPGQQVGFHVGAYDRTRPLIIDPVLSYSIFLGGSYIDEGYDIAVDPTGNAYRSFAVTKPWKASGALSLHHGVATAITQRRAPCPP